MTEILNQEELDALLLAISTGKVDAADYSVAKEEKKVKIYDFRRPDRFSCDHIRTLQMMHETFARLTTIWLSSRLNANVSLHVASVDQVTFEEFIRSLPNPATFGVVEMSPLEGQAILEIDPDTTFTVIDMLSGGLGQAAKISRELTDIEILLLENLFPGILNNLSVSWSGVIKLNPQLKHIETNPQFAQIVPPNEMVLLVTLEMKIGELQSMMNICIPYVTIEPLLERLSPDYSDLRAGGGTNPGTDKIKDNASFREYSVFTGAVDNMTIDDLRKLKPGMKIPLKEPAGVTKVYKYAGLHREVNNG